MKILFVVEYFPHEEITGGVEARSHYLSKHLAENHDVQVICSRQEGQPEESVRNGCKVYRVGGEHPYSHKGNFLSRLGFVDAALEKGEELDFDLVDGQSFLAYPAAYGIAEDAGVPCVAAEVPEAQMKVIGDGPEREKLENLSEKLDADIELLGYVPEKEDVIKVLKSSHLFVSASVLEGFGMSVIEAAASGTPYVVSDIEPHVEISKGERGGLIFEGDDGDDLAMKVLKLLRDPELYERKEEECSKISRGYGWGKIAEELERIYGDLV